MFSSFYSCSLEQLGPETDNVVMAFKQLAQEYEEKFSKEDWCLFTARDETFRGTEGNKSVLLSYPFSFSMTTEDPCLKKSSA